MQFRQDRVQFIRNQGTLDMYSGILFLQGHYSQMENKPLFLIFRMINLELLFLKMLLFPLEQELDVLMPYQIMSVELP